MTFNQVSSAHTVASTGPLSFEEFKFCADRIRALLPADGKILFPNHDTLLNLQHYQKSALPVSDLVIDAGRKLGPIARIRLSLGSNWRAHCSIAACIAVRPETFRPMGEQPIP